MNERGEIASNNQYVGFIQQCQQQPEETVFAVDLLQKIDYSRTIQIHTEADDGYGRDPRKAGAEGA